MSEHNDFEINVDMSGVEAWGGESGPPVPPGIYDLELLEVSQDVGKTSQKPTMKVVFGVANEGEFFGKKITKSYSLQEQSRGRVKQLMMACRAPLDAIRSRDLLGKFIVAEVVHVQGQAKANADGTFAEGKFFCDVINERAPEEEAPAATPPPPAQTAANQKSAVRRAVGKA